MQLPVLCVLVISCWLHAQLTGQLFNITNHTVLLGLCIITVGTGQFYRELSIKTFLKCNEVKHLDSFQRRTIELRWTFMGDNSLSGYENLKHSTCCEAAHCSVLQWWDWLTEGSSQRQQDTCDRALTLSWERALLCRGELNICLLERHISYKRSSNFNPFPGIFIFMKCISFLKFFRNACMKHTLKSLK